MSQILEVQNPEFLISKSGALSRNEFRNAVGRREGDFTLLESYSP